MCDDIKQYLRNKLVNGIKGRFKIDKISAVCDLFDSVCVYFYVQRVWIVVVPLFLAAMLGFYSVFITLEIEKIYEKRTLGGCTT